mmetsp:Transcript_30765/g.34453  ORF Transcript_30765/g.34453 Transcript_30765/m.34453 type:complete len:81 (-) Transcript_30765:48-290(-)
MESGNDDDDETTTTATISTSSMEFRNRVPDQMTKRDRQREERERRQYSTAHTMMVPGRGKKEKGWVGYRRNPGTNNNTKQ